MKAILVMITIMILGGNLLSKNQLRMSKQRLAILNTILDLRSHPTADEVYQVVRQKLPRISLGTVYRNLEILSSSGMIRKVPLGGPQMRFDGCTEDHVHIRCIQCGRVDDLPMDPPNTREGDIQKKSGYRIIGHCTVFIGICPVCQGEGGDEAA
jgi:Fur family ferric uptake transcriptional regulator